MDIFLPMRYAIFAALALLAACQTRRPVKRATRSATPPPPDLADFTRDSTDSVLHAPRVVTQPTVIVFWLPAGDTLNPDDAVDAFDELTSATQAILPQLTAFDIKLVPTHAETVYVALPNRQRRSILLSGLDYPYGYLLIEPGSPERILTGTYAEDELTDEVAAYFDLPQDTTKSKPRVTT
jgi:hypothetical protein